MIQKVNAPPLKFEEIVREIATNALIPHQFQFEPEIPAYQNAYVSYIRHRRGQSEVIGFGRCLYDEEDMAHPKWEDESDAFQNSVQGGFWPSRHLLYIQHNVNYGGVHLFPSGKMGYSLAGENLWRFTDAADLARRLRDEALPLILNIGMKWFDEALENELERIQRDEAIRAEYAARGLPPV